MKNKAVLISLLVASTVAGFVCTFVAGIMLATLNASTEPVSFWQYIGKVAGPMLGSAAGLFGRYAIRAKMRAGSTSAPPAASSLQPLGSKIEQPPASPGFVMTVSPADSKPVDRMLAAVGLEVNLHAAAGNTEHVRTLMDAADIIKQTSAATLPPKTSTVN